MNKTVVFVLRSAVLAAAYVGLAQAPVLRSISYGPVQVRIAEALAAFAFFEPAAVLGVTAGAVIANYLGPYGLIDAVWGGGLTFAATYLIWKARRPGPAMLYPVILKGVGIAFMLKYLVVTPAKETLPFLVFSIGGGETIALFLLGYPLLIYALNTGVGVRKDILAVKLGRRA